MFWSRFSVLIALLLICGKTSQTTDITDHIEDYIQQSLQKAFSSNSQGESNFSKDFLQERRLDDEVQKTEKTTPDCYCANQSGLEGTYASRHTQSFYHVLVNSKIQYFNEVITKVLNEEFEKNAKSISVNKDAATYSITFTKIETTSLKADYRQGECGEGVVPETDRNVKLGNFCRIKVSIDSKEKNAYDYQPNNIKKLIFSFKMLKKTLFADIKSLAKETVKQKPDASKISQSGTTSQSMGKPVSVTGPGKNNSPTGKSEANKTPAKLGPKEVEALTKASEDYESLLLEDEPEEPVPTLDQDAWKRAIEDVTLHPQRISNLEKELKALTTGNSQVIKIENEIKGLENEIKNTNEKIVKTQENIKTCNTLIKNVSAPKIDSKLDPTLFKQKGEIEQRIKDFGKKNKTEKLTIEELKNELQKINDALIAKQEAEKNAKLAKHQANKENELKEKSKLEKKLEEFDNAIKKKKK